MMDESLASYVSRHVARDGRTVEDIAKAANIGRTTLYDIKAGRAEHPDSETLKRLAPEIGADEDMLMLLAGHISELPVGDVDPRAAQIAVWLTRLTPTQREAALQMIEGVRVLIRGAGGDPGPNGEAARDEARLDDLEEEFRAAVAEYREEGREVLEDVIDWMMQENPDLTKAYLKERATQILKHQAERGGEPQTGHAASASR
jgi:transcriptional regulator with XRE-family HTH domain